MTTDLVLPGPATRQIAYLLAGVAHQNGGARLERVAQDLVDLIERTPAGMRPAVLESELAPYRNKDRVLQSILSVRPTLEPERPVTTYADLRRRYAGTTYFWPNWWPHSLLSLIGGPQGGGKSYLIAALCKTIITGSPWPDGAPYEHATGRVVLADTEAGQSLTLERLARFGVPDEGIIAPFDGEIAPNLDKPDHQAEMRRLMMRADVLAGVVDALRGAHKRDENASETYAITQWLAELTRDTGKPILLAHHIRKRGPHDGEPSLDWFRGSSGITQPTRCCWILHDPLNLPPHQDNKERALVQVKHNGSARMYAIGLRLVDDGVETCDLPRRPSGHPDLDEARQFVLEALRTGRQAWTAVEEGAGAEGISKRTLERARDALKNQGRVRKWTVDGHTVWGLSI